MVRFVKRAVVVVLVALVAGMTSPASAQPTDWVPPDGIEEGVPAELPAEPTSVADPQVRLLQPVEARSHPKLDVSGLKQLDGAGVEPETVRSVERVDPPRPATREKLKLNPAAVEQPAKRTARSEMYRNPDGSLTELLFSESKYYRDGNEFKRIDSTIEPIVGQPGHFKSKANAWTVRFGPLGANGEGVELQTETGALAMMPDADLAGRSIRPEPSGNNAVRYADVWPGIDVVYTVGPDGLKEDIVVKNKAAAAKSSYAFVLDGADLGPVTKGNAKDLPGAFATGALGDEWVLVHSCGGGQARGHRQ